MKKITLILLSSLMALCLFSGCSSDDEDDTAIVGKWQHAKTVASEVKTSSTEATEIIKDLISKDNQNEYSYEFGSEGQHIYYGGGSYIGIEYGTYKTVGGKLTFTNASAVRWTNEFSISGNTLLIYSDKTEYYQDKKKALGIAEDVVIEKVITVSEYTRIK